MPTYVLRVWLPDRPGALGAVASRIGAVRGDVIGIEILERGGGRVIDELVVSVPDATLLDLLVDEIGEVDGVDVEHIRLAGQAREFRLEALETAAGLLEHLTVADLLHGLTVCAKVDLDATWCCIVDLDGPVPLVSVGDTPSVPWLSAFVAGSRTSTRVAAGECGPDDVAWAMLATSDLALVLGRRDRPVRARERQYLAALARLADIRWSELVRHPHVVPSSPT